MKHAFQALRIALEANNRLVKKHPAIQEVRRPKHNNPLGLLPQQPHHHNSQMHILLGHDSLECGYFGGYEDTQGLSSEE